MAAATPAPPAPAPCTTKTSSARRRPRSRAADTSPASATAPVPWMSSLKLGSTFRYRSSTSKAVSFERSSHWSTARGQRFFTPSTKRSMKAMYASPRRRFWRTPRYAGPASRSSRSVPTSRPIGSERYGLTPPRRCRWRACRSRWRAHPSPDPRCRGWRTSPSRRHAHVVEDAVLRDLFGAVHVVRREREPAGALVDGGGLLHRVPDGGRVDDRQHLLEVPLDERVEEDLVPLLERAQVAVLGERRRLAEERGVGALDLELERLLLRREEAVEPERHALGLRKRRALVREREAREGGAVEVDAEALLAAGVTDELEVTGEAGHVAREAATSGEA